MHALAHLASLALISITCLTAVALEFIILALVLFYIFQWARGGREGTTDLSKSGRKVAELYSITHTPKGKI